MNLLINLHQKHNGNGNMQNKTKIRQDLKDGEFVVLRHVAENCCFIVQDKVELSLEQEKLYLAPCYDILIFYKDGN